MKSDRDKMDSIIQLTDDMKINSEEQDPVVLPPPPSFSSLLARLLTSLAKSPRDLYRLTAPAALHNGISLLEYCQHYGDHPQLISDISQYALPEERMQAVVRWFISTLHGSFASRAVKGSRYERKPFNPILGEQYRASWADHEQHIIAEQVSHHPPVSAFYIHSSSAKVHVHGYTGQSTNFNGTGIRVKQEGRLFVFIEEYNEEVTITLPELHLYGLTSCPYIEITGPSLFLSTSGWAADLDFVRSGVFVGARDTFTGVIYNNDTGIIHKHLWGNWKQQAWMCQEQFYNQKDRKETLFHSHQASATVHPITKPISEQADIESRRVWHKVTQALIRGDYDAAEEEKKIVEEGQRALRRERLERTEEWTPKLFTFTEEFYFLPQCDAELTVPSCKSVITHPKTEEEEMEQSEYSQSEDDSISFYGRWMYIPFYEKFVP